MLLFKKTRVIKKCVLTCLLHAGHKEPPYPDQLWESDACGKLCQLGLQLPSPSLAVVMMLVYQVVTIFMD